MLENNKKITIFLCNVLHLSQYTSFFYGLEGRPGRILPLPPLLARVRPGQPCSTEDGTAAKTQEKVPFLKPCPAYFLFGLHRLCLFIRFY